MKLYSGSANVKLGERIAGELNLPLLHPEKFIFPDGEERIRILESVVDEKVVIVQPLCTPVNENLVELAFIVDAIKRSGAKSVLLVVPYLGYQRQDHVFREGEAVSLEVVIKILEAVGVDKAIAFDLHSIKIPEMFHIPVIQLSALPLFAQEIKRSKIPPKDMVLISPDMGGIRRIKQLSELLGGVAYASIEKNRDLDTGGVEAKELHANSNTADVKGKHAFIMDDMISSGGTIVKAAALLNQEGVKTVNVFATHPVFSQNAPVLLQEADIEKVYVTDTIWVPKEKRFAKLEILSVSSMIATHLKS